MRSWTTNCLKTAYITRPDLAGSPSLWAMRFVEQDPLSPIANYNLGETLVALGKWSEAVAPLRLSLELDNEFAKWFVPAFDLVAGRHESAIARYEEYLARSEISDSGWVKDLVAGASDSLTGESYLDSRIPGIIASLPEEYAGEWQFNFDIWYLVSGIRLRRPLLRVDIRVRTQRHKLVGSTGSILAGHTFGRNGIYFTS